MLLFIWNSPYLFADKLACKTNACFYNPNHIRMIFKTEIEDFHLFESYKERNLYYKIFAGYYFNEIVPGYEERKSKFFSLLENGIQDEERIYGCRQDINEILSDTRQEKLNLTFDYHPAQIFKDNKKLDRGEMSDILITTTSTMISIECKFLSDFDIDKDILLVQRRIKKFSMQFYLRPIQVLLLKKEKWATSAKIKTRIDQVLDSNSESFIFSPIVVVFWEDILDLIDNAIVKEYLAKQLKRRLSIELL